MSNFETAPQLAKRWGITRGRVHQLIVEGKLPATKVGRDWLIQGAPTYFYEFKDALKEKTLQAA